MTRDEVIEWLTQWGISNRVYNYCGWPRVSILGRIENENVHTYNIPHPNTEKAVQGISEDERANQVGPDPKQIDQYKVEAIDRIMANVDPLDKIVARELYINRPVNPKNRRQSGESWVAIKLNIGRKVVRNSHSRLILFIQNDIELT